MLNSSPNAPTASAFVGVFDKAYREVYQVLSRLIRRTQQCTALSQLMVADPYRRFLASERFTDFIRGLTSPA